MIKKTLKGTAIAVGAAVVAIGAVGVIVGPVEDSPQEQIADSVSERMDEGSIPTTTEAPATPRTTLPPVVTTKPPVDTATKSPAVDPAIYEWLLWTEDLAGFDIELMSMLVEMESDGTIYLPDVHQGMVENFQLMGSAYWSSVASYPISLDTQTADVWDDVASNCGAMWDELTVDLEFFDWNEATETLQTSGARCTAAWQAFHNMVFVNYDWAFEANLDAVDDWGDEY